MLCRGYFLVLLSSSTSSSSTISFNFEEILNYNFINFLYGNSNIIKNKREITYKLVPQIAP